MKTEKQELLDYPFTLRMARVWAENSLLQTAKGWSIGSKTKK